MRQRGFTLIEIMVVVVIIGLLATLVLPRVLGRQDQAMIAKAKVDIQALSSALKLYKLDNFNYPSTSQGLEALIREPGGDPPAKNWKKGGYVERLPTDPWGNAEHQGALPCRNVYFHMTTSKQWFSELPWSCADGFIIYPQRFSPLCNVTHNSFSSILNLLSAKELFGCPE